jgi:hypothetical protein
VVEGWAMASDSVMDKLEITFADGNKLSCRGTISDTDGGSLRANEDGTFTEVRDSVQLYIHEGTLTRPNGPSGGLGLLQGQYLINKDGLWFRL